ncbi:DUF4426 domain-containing protein [Aliagarivorans taiwanensis]|uniref:DUF4426 domain-containing protein n=1 Tax=Aliagarivorans taiwanensis TaxID=561966 RepID=UPI000411B277|nr:DUF4426 domain-containing protein [Aliagarivorans taiwanensis]
MRILIAIFSLISALALPVHAEQKVDLGPWEVHYVVFNSTFIPPEVATAYGLKRNGRNALINISVLKAEGDDKIAQRLSVEGSAQNLLGNKKQLSFKEVREGESVYYLSQLTFSNEETFNFDITLTQGNQTQRLQFSQQLYVD